MTAARPYVPLSIRHSRVACALWMLGAGYQLCRCVARWAP